MTAVLKIVAAAFAASISGAAMAAELDAKGNQAAGATPPPAIAAPSESPAPTTGAAIHAVSVYIQAKCVIGRDELLPPGCY